MAKARSITTAGWHPRRANQGPWGIGPPPGIREVDAGSGHVGALQPQRGLDAEQRSRGGDAGEARAAERAVRDGGGTQQSAAEWRRPVDSGIPSRDANCTPIQGSGLFSGVITRMPEFCAPALGNKPNVVTITADVPSNANGALDKLGSLRRGSDVLCRGRHPLLRGTTSSSSSARRFALKRSSRRAW